MITTTREALKQALDAARSWIALTPHGDNCFLHSDGGEFDKCFCGKDGLLDNIESILAAANAAEAKPAPESVALQTWPKHIWLQGGETEVEEYTGSTEDMTWCEDNINRGDVQYVRADIAALPAPVDAQIDRDAPTEGQEISIDVSTGDEDAGNRIFARLTGDRGSDGTWLAEETSRNFKGLDDVSLINEGDMRQADTGGKSVATVRVTNKGYAMELSTYVAYALPEGLHDLCVRPCAPAQPVQADPSAAVPNSILENIELVLARLEQMHKDSIPGTWRMLIEEAMPCALAIQRATAPAQQVQPAAQPVSGAVGEREVLEQWIANNTSGFVAEEIDAMALCLTEYLKDRTALSESNQVNTAAKPLAMSKEGVDEIADKCSSWFTPAGSKIKERQLDYRAFAQSILSALNNQVNAAQPEKDAELVTRIDDFGVAWEVTKEKAAEIDAAIAAQPANPTDKEA